MQWENAHKTVFLHLPILPNMHTYTHISTNTVRKTVTY